MVLIREKRDNCFSDLKISEMIFDTERIGGRKFMCSLKFGRTTMLGVGRRKKEARWWEGCVERSLKRVRRSKKNEKAKGFISFT